MPGMRRKSLLLRQKAQYPLLGCCAFLFMALEGFERELAAACGGSFIQPLHNCMVKKTGQQIKNHSTDNTTDNVLF